MKLSYGGTALLALTLSLPVWAQSDQVPSGTTPATQTGGGAVQPVPAPVHLSASDIQAAQGALNKAGYDSGTPDGKFGPKTRSAVSKYQKDKGLTETGQLDDATLSKLNVAAGATLSKAPHDVARGAKAAGHDVVTGHPVEAGKSMGKGIGRAGKAVGEGTKAGTVGTVDKVTGKDNGQPSQNQPQ